MQTNWIGKLLEMEDNEDFIESRMQFYNSLLLDILVKEQICVCIYIYLSFWIFLDQD